MTSSCARYSCWEAEAAILQTIQARFRWISVDEYQDVNGAQYRLLRLLAAGGANLCVIGDPDQAIYGFRGADHRYFLSFAEDFPGGQRLFLERNYRSAQAILDAATQVISRNPDHQATALIADFAEQVKLDVYRAPTDKAEAEYVVHQVEQMVGGVSYFSLDSGRVDEGGLPEDRAFGDFAVLYRLNAQAKLLEKAFDRSGIPYETIGGASLAGTEADPGDPCPSVADADAGQPRSLGAGLAGGQRCAGCRGGGRTGDPATVAVAERPPGGSPRNGRAALSGVPLPGLQRGAQRERLAQTLDLVRALADSAAAPLSERIQAAAAGWAKLRGGEYSDAEAERIERLQSRAAPLRNRLQDFLTTMALQSGTDLYDQRADRVTLMSLHASKGAGISCGVYRRL